MTDQTAADYRDQLRGMALSLATGSGAVVEPSAFDAALGAYRDAVLAESAAVAPAVAPAVDRAETRDRIAETLYGFTPVPEIPWEQAPESDRTRYQRRAGAVLAVLPDTGHAVVPVCICGHPEQRHFEDVCQTCDCGDYLEPEAAREVIARWRTAALNARAETAADLPTRLAACLTERYTELGNPFSEMRRREQGPDGWPASHPVGPHHVAEALRELLADGARQDGATP